MVASLREGEWGILREPLLGIGEEAVADAADGGEVLRVCGVVFDITAEADDEVVNRAGVCVLVDTPHLFEDVFAGDDLAFAFGEEAEQVGLHHGEVREPVRGDQFERIEVDGAVVEGVGLGRWGFAGRLGCGRGLGGLPCGAAE